MKIPKVLAPVNSVKDISLVAKTKCKKVYAYHTDFLEEENYNKIADYAAKAKENELEFFINFKSTINEEDIFKVKKLIDFIISCPIDGILINSYGILEFIKTRSLPFKIYIDSGINIHNLSGIEFVNLFHIVDNINITEEIYLKNLIKIKKYTKYKLSIDTDNLPWIAEDVLKNKSIEIITIKGDFKDSKELLEGIHLIEKIIESPKIFKNQKLPFKNPENAYYKSNHFSGEILSAEGKDFKFAGNIQQFKWNFKRVKSTQKSETITQIPRLNLRLTSLEQLKAVKKFLKNSNFNPIYSIEYGEIVNTADLAKYNFNKLIDKAKKDCLAYGIKLQLSTPRILIERDFDRVYEYVKLLCIQEPYPTSLIVNNIGYWWSVINDSDLDKLPIELGQGLNLLNSASISCLANQHQVSSIDLSNFTKIENIKLCIDKIKDKIPTRKITIAGSIRVPSSGLCPLNNDSAIVSRLSCAAPCHHGNYAISDPSIGKTFPISVDGFCRMHLYKDQVLDLFKYIPFFQNIGINEFIIDFSGLPANFVPVLLNRFLDSFNNKNYVPDQEFLTDQYMIESYFEALSI